MAQWVPDDRDGLDRLVAEIVALFTDAETRLTRSVALMLSAGLDAGASADRAIRLGELRTDAQQIAAELRTAYPDQLERIMAIAAESGAAAALQEMSALAGVTDTTATTGVSGAAAAQTARADLTSTLDDVVLRVLRFPDDVYRRAVAQTATDVLLGLGTQRTAQARAWQQLVAQGVTGFTDTAGRRWNLATYVEMATRSATRRAWDDQHAATMTEHGVNLVSVVVGSGSCKACADQAGKILRTDSGPTGRIVVPSAVGDGDVTVKVDGRLDDAKRHGWRHPNCRCRIVAYLPGLSVVADATTYDPDAEAAREKLRDLERRVRKAKVGEAAAVSPETRKVARTKRLDLQRQIAAHTRDTGLLRRRRREQVSLGQRFAPNDGPTAA